MLPNHPSTQAFISHPVQGSYSHAFLPPKQYPTTGSFSGPSLFYFQNKILGAIPRDRKQIVPIPQHFYSGSSNIYNPLQDFSGSLLNPSHRDPSLRQIHSPIVSSSFVNLLPSSIFSPTFPIHPFSTRFHSAPEVGREYWRGGTTGGFEFGSARNNTHFVHISRMKGLRG